MAPHRVVLQPVDFSLLELLHRYNLNEFQLFLNTKQGTALRAIFGCFFCLNSRFETRKKYSFFWQGILCSFATIQTAGSIQSDRNRNWMCHRAGMFRRRAKQKKRKENNLNNFNFHRTEARTRSTIVEHWTQGSRRVSLPPSSCELDRNSIPRVAKFIFQFNFILLVLVSFLFLCCCDTNYLFLFFLLQFQQQ